MTTFLGLEIETTQDTFIPRPETELLVKTCLDLLDPQKPASILDIGTGSGNIAVLLTKMHKNCTIIALDRSFEALEVAVRNAERHGVRDRITFIKSDLFSDLEPILRSMSCLRKQASMQNPCIDSRFRGNDNIDEPDTRVFDMIVSNPPYVASWEIATLASDVRNEPLMALDGGEDGLEAIRKIIEGSPRFLKNGASLVMEIGYDQAHKVKKALQACGGYRDIDIVRDLSNIERIVKAQWTS